MRLEGQTRLAWGVAMGLSLKDWGPNSILSKWAVVNTERFISYHHQIPRANLKVHFRCHKDNFFSQFVHFHYTTKLPLRGRHSQCDCGSAGIPFLDHQRGDSLTKSTILLFLIFPPLYSDLNQFHFPLSEVVRRQDLNQLNQLIVC